MTEVNTETDNTHKAHTSTPAESASRRLVTEVQKSLSRNNADSGTDNSWVAKDQKSSSLAQTTQDAANRVNELIKNGQFDTPEGHKAAEQLIKDLRANRTDHEADRAGAKEYAGKTGLSEAAQNSIQHDSEKMAAAAKTLGDKSSSKEQQAAALNDIEAAAKGIHGAAAKGDQTSKDVRDMASESQQVLATVNALRNPNLSAEQRSALVASIDSKASSLIPNELRDLRNETSEIKNDSAAIQSGARLEAQLRAAMQHPGDVMTQAHLQDTIKQLNQNLDGVKADRAGDAQAEPGYSAANNRDNAINRQILELTNPYHRTH